MRFIVVFLILFSLWVCAVPLARSIETLDPSDEVSQTQPAPAARSSNGGGSLLREGISAMTEEVGISNPLNAVKRTANEAARSIGRSLGQYVRGQYQQIKNNEMLERFDYALLGNLSGLPLNSEERAQMIYEIQQAYIQDAETGRLELDQTNFRDLPLLVRKNYSETVLRRTRDGIVETFDERGHLKTRWTKQGGLLNGPAITYYPNGEIRYIDVYEQGWKVNRKKYDEEGQLIFDQAYAYEKTEAPAPAVVKEVPPAVQSPVSKTAVIVQESVQAQPQTLSQAETVRKIPVLFVDTPAAPAASRQ